MSVQGTTEEETARNAAPGAGQAKTPHMAAPGVNAGGGGNLFDLINTLGAGRSLGGPIEEYLKNIKSYFGNDTTSSSFRIDVRRLTEPNGAHAFIVDKKAIVMLFAETLQSDVINFTPTSDYAGYAFRALTNSFGEDMKLVNVIVVIPGDYPRAQQMAQSISVSLQIATSAKLHDTNISLLADSQYSIDPDVVATRNYINNLNPSCVAPRVDIGFVIYAKQPRRGGNMQLGPMENSVPIAAVGGYTEILVSNNQAQGVKYLPMVHITSIASDIPLPGIVPLCITIAADQFVSTGRWLQPFMTFQKGKPNLGQLFPDTQDPKKLYFAPGPQELDTLRFNHFLPAVLAVDVAQGQSRIPALAAYGHLSKVQSVYDQIQNFFGAKIPLDRNVMPYFEHATDFLGVYGDRAGNQVDSRHMDYMTLLAEGSLDAAAQILLGYPQEIAIRSRLISDKTGGTFRSLYRTTISVLSPQLLSTLAMAVQQSLSIDAPQGANRMNSTDWMRAQSALYQSQNFNVTRSNSPVGYGIGASYFV